MWTRKLIAAALLAAGMIATPLPGMAQVSVELDFGPPAPRYEVVPPPRPGYTWAPGYHYWDGRQHVWRSGYWIAEQPGYVYYGPTWVEREGRWAYQGPRWDRDGDGVPNRYDARPNNPYRQ